MNDTTPTADADADADLLAIKRQLAAVVRHAALTRLKSRTRCEDIEVSELDADFVPGRILANHMAFILISGAPLRITFKVHFSNRTARSLAYRSFGCETEDDIAQTQAFDFLKEYCNLTAGMVVTRFEQLGVDLGIGLPLCTRGFYEVFSDYTPREYPFVAYGDFWKFKLPDNEIYCSALLEIIDRKPLQCLIGYTPPDDGAHDGGMEFL